MFLQAQLLKFLMRIVAYQRSGSIRKITTIRMLGSDHHIREVVLMMVVTTDNIQPVDLLDDFVYQTALCKVGGVDAYQLSGWGAGG